MRVSDMNTLFHQRLDKVQSLRPDLISTEVDVEEVYGIERSLRRGSTQI